MRTNYPLPLPSYVVELLQAARLVLHSDDHDRFRILEDAVIAFEEEMPLASDGEIFAVEPNFRRDADHE